jgi:hypothetical protein
LVVVNVLNIGEGASEGTVTVTDVLPPGVIATDAGLVSGPEELIGHELWDCSGIGTSVVTCTNDPTSMPHLAAGASVPNFRPNLDPPIGIAVKVIGGPGVESNRVSIVGGGAPTAASAEGKVVISSAPATLGVTGWDVWFSNPDGTIDTQAGSHPYEATFSLGFASEVTKFSLLGLYAPAGGEVRNIEAKLPPGFVGDPTAVPECTHQQLLGSGSPECPGATQVGILQAYVDGGAGFRSEVYNMVPPVGVAAEFAAYIEGVITLFDATVRGGGDYGITEHIDNIPRKNLIGNVLTLWGVPGDPSHDPFRTGAEGGCHEGGAFSPNECKPDSAPLKPFLTLPTSCGEAQPFSISANTWQDPSTFFGASVLTHDANGVPTGFTGCEDLGFAPTITTSPDTSYSDTPAGLTVEVKPPVGGLEDPEQLGTSDIQNTTVALPEGLAINPGQAAGLQACPVGRPSFEPGNERYGDALTTEEEKVKGEEDDGPANCPPRSKIGTVKIRSPLIEATEEKEFEGNVYVLQSNPPDLKLLVAASADGVNLKLVGDVHICESAGETIAGKTCEAPGQLITTFEHTPELPSTLFKLSFSGGPQAALDTPAQCGSYTTTSEFVPWSNMPGSSQNFISDAFPTAAFSLTEGPGGGPCSSSPLPFAPELIAGSTTDQAGGFTNFSLLLERGDGQQRIERLQFKAPEGLSGMLSQVPLCPEPQAQAGTCSSTSQIGHATVASGPGPYPLVIPQPGEPESPIYLTGAYEGAPFGLSIVTHVLAGPFNLGTIVTRARIEIDPHTAQITVTTDPLPQVVAGVPTDLRLINSVIDRPGFMFNPTNCASQAFSGTAWGAAAPGQNEPSTSAPISTHFGVGSCRELAFSPDFKVSTSGRTSKARGASLDVKVQYPSTSPGHGQATSQANIASVKVELPKQLPSRLTTLQKACTAAQFSSNPAGCPAASIVGHAVVHTPVLPVPLEGPAYFVSNGGEAFPNLIMVLQGYGVTVELVGDTFINKAGITSSTFKSTPDVPFSSFELNLPEGPFSALAANTNLCAPTKTKTVKKRVTVRRRGRTRHLVRKLKELVPETLTMPTTIVGQNGAEIHQNTKVEVTGCSKAVRHERKKAKRGKGKTARRKRKGRR